MTTPAVTGRTSPEPKSACDKDGICGLPYRFGGESVELLRRRVADISARRRPEVVHEENGPLVVIPGSHTMGLFDLPDKSADSASDWRRHVSNDLAYTVGADRADRLIAQNGTSTILGAAGSLHAFHPSIVHSSSNNRSADRRALLLITYNAVANTPANPTRPAFLVGRDTTPITALHDERLVVEDGRGEGRGDLLPAA
ncbi:phytanoyl-CoA dioxygenase family protein [Streptomyces sp. NPDC051578]|uniref:phytanoyl-CoA dioxygenase family protein n=1 Tax=Streptomyces sp. NPDC051578 TaxID=3365662 RepID=UPI003796BAB0